MFRYRLARFVGIGNRATFGTGDGGDVVVTFNQGSYELSGAGEKPITVTLAGQRAKLTAAGQTQTLKMPDVVKVLAPQGSAVLACSGERMAIATGQIRLELERA